MLCIMLCRTICIVVRAVATSPGAMLPVEGELVHGWVNIIQAAARERQSSAFDQQHAGVQTRQSHVVMKIMLFKSDSGVR